MKRAVCLGLALGIVVALTATLGFRVGAGTTRGPSPPAVQESNHAYVAPSSVGASSQPSPIPAVTTDAAPTVSLFVMGWLSAEPKRRRALIESTCSLRLAELLLLSDPAKLPDARPVGPPTLVRRGVGVESYAQGLSDGTSIAVDLAADPGRSSGWTVTSVRPGNF
jgi:hypothetical protein